MIDNNKGRVGLKKVGVVALQTVAGTECSRVICVTQKKEQGVGKQH
jgi:hypothetical protein